MTIESMMKNKKVSGSVYVYNIAKMNTKKNLNYEGVLMTKLVIGV